MSAVPKAAEAKAPETPAQLRKPSGQSRPDRKARSHCSESEERKADPFDLPPGPTTASKANNAMDHFALQGRRALRRGRTDERDRARRSGRRSTSIRAPRWSAMRCVFRRGAVRRAEQAHRLRDQGQSQSRRAQGARQAGLWRRHRFRRRDEARARGGHGGEGHRLFGRRQDRAPNCARRWKPASASSTSSWRRKARRLPRSPRRWARPRPPCCASIRTSTPAPMPRSRPA